MKSLEQEFQRRSADSKRIVLILDFDGTLAPIVAKPEMARIGKAQLQTLRRLQRCRNIDIVILSGRVKSELTSRIPIRGVSIIGEHGLVQVPRAAWRRSRWKKSLLDLTQELGPVVTAESGALLESKAMSLAVHFRRVKAERQEMFVAKLRRRLKEFPGTKNFRLRRGKKILEVLPDIDWGKGKIAEQIERRQGSKALVLAIGDDETDEEMFQHLKKALTIKVGRGKTAAKFRLSGTREVLRFLNWLAKESVPRMNR